MKYICNVRVYTEALHLFCNYYLGISLFPQMQRTFMEGFIHY
jgi:hypothetical protein